MVSNTNRSDYDNIMTGRGLSGSMKLRNPDSPNSVSKSRSKSPGSIRKSRSKSPGVGRISSRTWSPGQATLFRRKKIEGEDEVTDILKGGNDEEVDYLKLSLDAIDKSERRGRRPQKSKSMDRSATSSIRVRPQKSTSIDRSAASSTRSRPQKSTSIDRSAAPSTRSRGIPRKSYSTGNASTTSTRSSRRVAKSKSIDRSKPELNQRELPMEIQRRLYAVTDPDISIKEKVERELEFMKGTAEEKRIYLQYRHHFDRQEFFEAQAFDEQEKQDNIDANAREEKLKEAEFLKTVELKRQKERQKEEEARERERRALEQAKMHSLETLANTMSEIKNKALEAATVTVARNQFQKKNYEDERRKLVEDFRKKEGKDMTDVERALKEARIEQEDPEEKRMKLRGGRPYRNI